MAEIIPKGKGKFLVRVYLGRVDGVTRYHNKTVRGTKSDARKYARQTETKRDLGQLTKASSEDLTLNKFLNRWLKEFKRATVKERTYESYVWMLDHCVRPYLGGDRLTELTARRVQNFYNELTESGYSPRIVAYTHSLLREALDTAVIDGLIPSNPTLSTRRPPRVKKSIEVFTPEEAERFMQAAASELVLWFAFATGARPEEYLALAWSDVDLKKCEVFFHRSVWFPRSGGWKFEEVKTQSSLRTVNFSATLGEALARHKMRQLAFRLKQKPGVYENHDLVFPAKLGTPMQPNNLARRHLAPVLDKAEIGGQRNLYRLRHSFATLSLLAGADLKSVSAALGHRSVAFTQDTYQHVLPAMRADAAEKIGQMLFKAV